MVQIYIVNLPSRDDRLQKTLSELNKAGATSDNIHLIKAIDTRTASFFEIQKRFPQILEESLVAIKNGVRDEHHQLTSGAVGCFYSHREAWKMIMNSTHCEETHVIIEDDIRFVNYFEARNFLTSENMLQTKLRTCDIFLLGHVGFMPDHPILSSYKSHEYPPNIPVGWFIGLQAYAMKQKTAQILLQNLCIPNKQLDWQLSELIPQGKLRVQAAVKRVCKVLDQDSDIQTLQPCEKPW